MIAIGSVITKRMYVGTKNVLRAYYDGDIIFSDMVSVFKQAVLAAGGTFEDDVFLGEWDALNTLILSDAKYVLIPGAYRVGAIYAIERATGALVEFLYSRSGTATYFDKNGDMQTAVSNMPRIDYDPLTLECRGYLMEKATTASTNYATNSNVFAGNAEWGSVTTGISYKGITFTQGTTVNASGGIKTVLSVAASQARICISFYIKHVSGGGSTFGVYVNRTGGGNISGAIRCNITSGAIEANSTNLIASAQSQDIGNGYYRLSIVLNDWLEGGSLSIGYSNNAGGVYQIANLQVENAAGATSYIPTSGSQVTRPVDVCRSLTDLVHDTATSVFMDLDILVSGSSNSVNRNIGSSGVVGRLWYNTTFPQVSSYDGTTALMQNAPYAINGQPCKTITSFGSGGQKLATNGSPIASGAYDGAFGNTGPLAFFTGGAGLITGHIKALAIFHSQLTDQQHLDLATT